MHKKIPLPEHGTATPILVRTGEKTAPILFEQLMVAIKRGTNIGVYYTGVPDEITALCNHQRGGPITWTGDRFNVGGVHNEAGNTFHRTMTSFGYDVVGNPDMVFGSDKDISRARFKVAAVVTDIKANICRVHDFWHGIPQGTDIGEMWLEVKWMVYSSRQEKIVAEYTTTGYFTFGTPQPDGFEYLFMEAFSGATEQLAAIREFHDLLSGQGGSAAAAPMGPVGEMLALSRKGAFAEPLANHSGQVLNAVVSLRLAQSHGSGFLVSEDGLILTNAHVVGNADSVNVRFPGGFELPGKVLKVHAARDVALVKVEMSHAACLPIRTAPLAVAEPVYAIGAPLSLELASTLSKGVVSALRTQAPENQPIIQADADIHGGNSGGPLVDANGNVVGISVSGISEGGSNLGSGLNFFIPIADALAKLNITLAD
jgi:S1-C subfamily serine protease